MTRETVIVVLLLVLAGGLAFIWAVPAGYTGYAVAGVFWLQAAVYGWIFRRRRRIGE